MANIAIFDESTNQVKEYIKSANTPEYQGRTDVVINPSVPNVPIKYWKHSGGAIVEMTQPEKDAVDQAEADADLASRRERADRLDYSIEDLFTAFVKVYNSKVRIADRITKQELIDQLKADKGL